MAVNIKKIGLSELNLNPDNFRYEPASSQREAIDIMIKKEKGLFALAKDILENGLNPNDKIAVVYAGTEEESPTVLEGNRRVLAMKLLDNPNLIEKNENLKKKFLRLKKNSEFQIPIEIEVNVFDDPSEVYRWISLKHTGENLGAGTVGWDGTQTARYRETIEKKTSTSLQIFKLLQESSDVPTEIKSKLKTNPKITNFSRMMDDPDVRNFLGIELENGSVKSSVSKKEVIKGLTQLASDLLDPQFTVGKIYSKEDRVKYLSNFNPKNKPDVGIKASKPWYASPQTQTKNSAQKVQSSPSERKVLIPKSCSIKISNAKVSKIFTELKRLDIEKYPHATSVLLRVILELSCDSYIENRQPEINTRRKDNPTLREKVQGITDDMIKNGFATGEICKGIRTSVSNKDSIFSIDTFHNYVHNKYFSPTRENLITAWDNIQEFMIRMWTNTVIQ